MRIGPSNSEHIVRLAILLTAGLVFFAVVRHFVVPKGFGLYGHYRAPAIDDIRARPAAFAGHNTCATCHPDVIETISGGRHKNVFCEACHGPLAKHADSGGEVKPAKLDAAVLCARCHEADAAKPKNFPQQKTREHSGGEVCTSCHVAHRPKMGA